MGYSQTIITPANNVAIPIPGYMNTFKEADRNNGEENRNRQDNYGRKTRTPAPKVNPNNKKATKKRSEEKV
ncbi:hypothetical protein KKH82_06370 [Patescibacteria group bacterium]|nr:hypothetical protein [Patescibacteria group bacterium]